jgi:sarcosine oxidase subunit beta
VTHPLPGYSTELPATADVAIVGGGILGAAAAYFCGRAGLSCVVLERRPMIGTLNTSAATGAFRAQFDNPDELALVRESIAFFERFGDETGLEGWDLGIRRQGYLWIATSEATASRQRELVARQAAWGLDDVEIVSAHELGARWPYLAPIALQARFRAGDGASCSRPRWKRSTFTPAACAECAPRAEESRRPRSCSPPGRSRSRSRPPPV